MCVCVSVRVCSLLASKVDQTYSDIQILALIRVRTNASRKYAILQLFSRG